MLGTKHKIGNGTMPIDFGWGGAFMGFNIVGGPYDKLPSDMFGVCVRRERTIGIRKDVWLPIDDFSVPQKREDVVVAVKLAITAALQGKNVYVGCMGGWGRTGLFLALLAKACGVPNPVLYVRLHYAPHAVETPEQFRYVDKFDVSELAPWVLRQTWLARFHDTFFWWAK